MKDGMLHFRMFIDAVKSSVLTDADIVELYDRLLRDYGKSHCLIPATMVFHCHRVTALMDYCRERLEAMNDDDCRMLLWQIDDPDVDDESVSMTAVVLWEKLARSDHILAISLVNEYRPGAVKIIYGQVDELMLVPMTDDPEQFDQLVEQMLDGN